MNGSRTALIPIAHIAAEVVAYPFASEAGLDKALTSLCPELSGDTKHLWRCAERDLLRTNPAVALDELVAIRDDTWFYRTTRSVSLAVYLRNTAARFFEVRGARALPRLKPHTAGPPGHAGDGAARSFQRWLSFALPLDLLLAALGDGERFPLDMQTCSPLLERRLRDFGFAEPHVHLNGCFDFASIWVGTLRGLADPSLKPKEFESPGSILNEGKDLAAWLIRAALARYVLAAFLDQQHTHQKLEGFLHAFVHDRIMLRLRPGADSLLAQVLEDLRAGHLSDISFVQIQHLYSCIIDKRRSPLPRSLEEVWAWDPIASFMSGNDGPPEIRFMARALQYLERPHHDGLFADLFWQIVRVRCLYYRHLVQRPLTPGLQWFVRFFKRIKPARRLIQTELKAKMAASLCGAEQGLLSLEIRSAPESNISETFHEVLDVNRTLRRTGAAGDEAPYEFGIVWHFGRDRKGEWFEGEPWAHWSGTAADPKIRTAKKRSNPSGYRYGLFYKQKRKEARAAARLLMMFPRTLEVVRGLDLCTDEAGVPIWVMAPLLRYVRSAGDSASAALRERLGLEVPPLRVTPHAGEDFVHLLSGLRRLDEAIEHLRLGEGDRLGHALSLGFVATRWAELAGQVPVPREERLLDLAWEWDCYARLGCAAPGGRQALLQEEISEHTQNMFDEELTPRQVGQLVRDLHDERILSDLGFPDQPYREVEKGRWTWAFLYLTSPELFERGREILWINPAEEAEALQFLQDALREKVGRLGLTIEVNPSSNLLIGNLGDLDNHPLWNLCPPNERGEQPLSICIGSDDPLTFATTLRDEYQLLYDALVHRGNSEVANEWLERARSAGWNARFTLPASRQLWPVTDSWRDPGRETLRFSPLAWTSKIDLPP